MTWFLIVLPVTRFNEQWTFSGPNGEPGQLTQPAPVVIPRTNSLPYGGGRTPTTINPTSWVDGASNTVWYFPNRFNPWVDDHVKGTGVGVSPATSVVQTDAFGWWVRLRLGNWSRTLNGERPTFVGAQTVGRALIHQLDTNVTDDQIVTLADLVSS